MSKLFRDLRVMAYFFFSMLLFSIPNESKALLSFNNNCAVALVICWSYDWSGVCQDGTPVGGGGEWTPEDCAASANQACASHGGLVAAPSCPLGLINQNGVCVARIEFPMSALTQKEILFLPDTSTGAYDDSFDLACMQTGKWACKGKCISKSTACGVKCPSRSRLVGGKCVLDSIK